MIVKTIDLIKMTNIFWKKKGWGGGVGGDGGVNAKLQEKTNQRREKSFIRENVFF